MADVKTAACFAVVGASVACAGGRGPAVETAIAEIEAGHRTTPLVAQPSPGSDAEVTFLVKSSDGRVPRIVSDVTGWGESPDDSTFDLTTWRDHLRDVLVSLFAVDGDREESLSRPS